MCKILVFVFSSLITFTVSAQAPSWPNPNNPKGLRYTLQQETIEYPTDTKTYRWFGVRHGDLWGAVREDRQSARLRLNSTLGRMLSLEETFLKKFQVEVGYENPGILYGLLGYEIPIYSPITFFVASTHRPHGDTSFLGGPVLYLGDHNLQILYYGGQKDSKVKQSVSLRQNLRFPLFWLTAEGVWRDTEDDTFSPWGYGLGVGIKQFYVRGSVSPYWDGFLQQRKMIEIGFETERD